MKTRILHTKIWKDTYFSSLTDKQARVFLFLLTNDNVNMHGIYELNDMEIKLWCQIKTDKQLALIKQKFEEDQRFFFPKGWVIINNHGKYNTYGNGEKQEVSYRKEYEQIPQYVLDYKDNLNTSMHTGGILDINHKPEIINKKEGGVRGELSPLVKGLSPPEYEEIAQKYNVPLSFVLSKWDDVQNYCASTGRKYKDYKATLRNWVKKEAVSLRKEANGRSKIDIITPDPTWHGA